MLKGVSQTAKISSSFGVIFPWPNIFGPCDYPLTEPYLGKSPKRRGLSADIRRRGIRLRRSPILSIFKKSRRSKDQVAPSKKEKETAAEAEAAAARVAAQAAAEARELKERAITESKQEIAKLVVLGTEKLLREKATA